MSTYIRARFYLDKDGKYVETWLGFTTEDLSKAAGQFKTFASGWEAGTKFKCMWMEAITLRSSNWDLFFIPEDTDRFIDFLEKYRRV